MVHHGAGAHVDLTCTEFLRDWAQDKQYYGTGRPPGFTLTVVIRW
jgi:hypothetical protein